MNEAKPAKKIVDVLMQTAKFESRRSLNLQQHVDMHHIRRAMAETLGQNGSVSVIMEALMDFYRSTRNRNPANAALGDLKALCNAQEIHSPKASLAGRSGLNL